MSRRRPKTAEHNAGAFLSPYGTTPIPTRTLSDDYRDEPTEPVDSAASPNPSRPVSFVASSTD